MPQKKPARSTHKRRAKVSDPTLEKAIRVIVEKRIEDECFRDDEEANSRAFISTCEGLESIFIPAVSECSVELRSVLDDFPDLTSCVEVDIKYIFERCSSSQPFQFPGYPYVTKGSRAAGQRGRGIAKQ